jgi:AraC-like DNA-binding protein
MEEKAIRLLTILKNRSIRYSPNNNVLNAIHQIESEQGRVSVETVARSVGYSRRSLERRFKESTGISVKKFTNHVRFNWALRLLLNGKSLANVAYDCAYFDQAHFTACFKELSGTTPGQFVKDRSLGILYLR